jgi:hypothetical protein
MDYIPSTAVTMAIGMVIIIWAFLLHMILNQAPDAHLQFFLDLMDTREEPSKNSPSRGSSPVLPGNFGTQTPQESAQRQSTLRSAQYGRQEVPLLFTALLRGRGL